MSHAQRGDSTPALTIFMWGYWGWGNATAEFVRLVDAAENRRGFRAPLFVDIRVRRAVRAEGFRENNFEQTVGAARYHWLQDLGNQSIIDGGDDIRIRRPEAARELLALAAERSAKRQRVIFFCSCKFPCACHRTTVAKFLLSEARHRGCELEVVEWPGGEPGSTPLAVNVSAKSLRNFRKTRSSLALDGAHDLALLGSMPVGTLVTATAPDEEPITFAAFPAIMAGGRWALPAIWTDDDKPLPLAAGAIRRRRRELGYAVRSNR